MPKVRSKNTESSENNVGIRPALTPEAEENQLIALSYNLVKKRLIEGTASSQETTHFLKLGSMKSKLELKKLEAETKMLEAKTESLQSTKRMEELYAEAIAAMQTYGGHGRSNEH